MPVRRGSLLVALVVAAAGCGDAGPATGDAGDDTGPLTALPGCEAPPTPVQASVEGLIVPDGTVVTGVAPQDPIVNVDAYVPMTPVQFEQAYPAMDGVEVLVTENELYESELLVSDGHHRNFLKATATCREGSRLLIVVAPEVDAEGLPLPRRATATPAP